MSRLFPRSKAAPGLAARIRYRGRRSTSTQLRRCCGLGRVSSSPSLIAPARPEKSWGASECRGSGVAPPALRRRRVQKPTTRSNWRCYLRPLRGVPDSGSRARASPAGLASREATSVAAPAALRGRIAIGLEEGASLEHLQAPRCARQRRRRGRCLRRLHRLYLEAAARLLVPLFDDADPPSLAGTCRSEVRGR